MCTQPRLTTLHRGAGKPDTSQYMDVRMHVYALYGVKSRALLILVKVAALGRYINFQQPSSRQSTSLVHEARSIKFEIKSGRDS